MAAREVHQGTLQAHTQASSTAGMPDPNRLAVVGIGASAGGIRALQTFFQAIPPNSGIAFVVVVHLSPECESALPQALQTCASMPVQHVKARIPMEPNHVYVIPPNQHLEIADGHLDVSDFEGPRCQFAPIDVFFRDLAEAHPDSIGILLAGSGTDGMIGLQAIKERGGIAMVQRPEEAEFDTMPRSAIAAGLIDFILPAAELATKVVGLHQCGRAEAPVSDVDDPHLRQMEAELETTRAQLQSALERAERQREELKAAHAELQSINEEHKSTLLALKTSQEELQAINEELKTVNQELQDNIEDLIQANNNLYSLMAATEVAMLFVDRELTIRFYTPALTQLFHIMPVDQGRPLAHVTHRLDYEHLLDDIQQVLDTLVPVEREVSQADERYYLMRLLPYRTADDSIDGAVITFVDITAHQRAETARQALTAQLAIELNDAKQLQQISTLLIQEGDVDALYEQILNAAITLMRADAGSMQRFDAERGALQLLVWKGFHPESAAFWAWVEGDSVGSCGVALHTGQRVIIPDTETYAPMVGTPDLEAFRRSDIRAMQSTPLISRSGRALGMISTHWRQPYSPPERDLRLLDVLARQAADLIERAQTEAALHQANTGLERRVAERTAELEQAHDRLRREMAERQRMQEALFQREKLAALGLLLANVAHELNNPLSVATMEIDNLVEARPADFETEALDTLRQAVERCSSVVQSFLALARQQPTTRRPVGLNTLINEVLILLRHALEADGITLKLHLAAGLPPLYADASQLHHVISNLITNAHHALRQSAPPRRLTLTTAVNTAGTHVTLGVADTGPGIPSELQRRIFEPFFTTRAQAGGSGLGLSLCRSIIEGHGGAIFLASQVGQGTTVHIMLPVAPPSEVQAPEAPDEAEASEPTRRGRILIIDDELTVRRALRRLLRYSGHDITLAANGHEALAALQERAYDVILSDIRMPGLDGPGLYREVERRYPHLVSQIIFLTGDTLSPEVQTFFDQVGCLHLVKPFRAWEVRRLIHQVLEAQ